MSASDIWSAPAVKARAVVPSDVTEVGARALWIGGAGIVTGQLLEDADGTLTSFTCVAGQFLSVSFKRIYATGTSATLILALF
jgi:hypothetical protein